MVTVFYEDDGNNKKKKYVLLLSSDLITFTVFLQTDELNNKWELCDEDKTAEIALIAELGEGEVYKAFSPDRISKSKFIDGINPFLEFINAELDNHLSNSSEPLSNILLSAKNNQDAICDTLDSFKASTDRLASYLIESMGSNAKNSILFNIPKNDYEFLASFKENWESTFNDKLPFNPSPIKGFDNDNENEK